MEFLADGADVSQRSISVFSLQSLSIAQKEHDKDVIDV